MSGEKAKKKMGRTTTRSWRGKYSTASRRGAERELPYVTSTNVSFEGTRDNKTVFS